MSEKSFDRSKFRGAKMSSNKSVVEDAVEKTNTGGGGGRKGYHRIEEGKNILRIAPPHDPEDPCTQPVSKVWLDVTVKDKDGNEEVKRRPIFNAKIHSPLNNDLVDMYIDFLMKLTYGSLSKDEARKKLAPVTGWRGSDGKWNSGIKPQLGFVAYAWKGEELARVELNQTIINRMNELSIDEESDETIVIDPFSDPDTGVSLIITYDKSAEASKKYLVNRGMQAKPLTDAQLMELDEQESLKEMFHNAYTKEDFKKSLDGLQRFDEKHKFGLFKMDEFLDLVEQFADEVDSNPDIRESYKSDEDGDDEATPAPTKSATKAVAKAEVEDDEVGNLNAALDKKTETEDEDEDGINELTKEELMDFVNENGLSDFVTLKKAFSQEKMVGLVREGIKAKQSAGSSDEAWNALKEETEGLGDEKPVVVEEPSVDDRVARMKARLGGGN